MITVDQEWLTPKQVADAFGHDVGWVYDQIRTGKSNRAGTNGIPARMVRKVGGSVHIHRSFVYPSEHVAPLQNVVTFPAPISDKQMDDLADRVVSRMLGLISERFGLVVKDRVTA